MALREIADENGIVQTQGFREGGGAPAYVYLAVNSPFQTGAAALEPEEADMLAEYLRQEAEYARSVREEEAK